MCNSSYAEWRIIKVCKTDSTNCQRDWNKEVNAKLNTYPAHFNNNLKVPVYKTLLTETGERGGVIMFCKLQNPELKISDF